MSSEQDYKPKFKSSSEVLLSLFENGKSPISEAFLRWKLWAKWSELVGPSLAQNAEPVGLKDGVLHLWVKNSTWMQQMTFVKDQLRVTLNQKLGMELVKSIRYTLDRREAPSLGDQAFGENLKKITRNI